jgi:titin
VVTGLTNGTTYRFVVAAMNASGTGQASLTSSAVPSSIPDAVQSASAMSSQNSQTFVSWMAPVRTGGIAISGYSVVTSPASSGCTTVTTRCVIAGLTNGTTYNIIITPLNANGAGPSVSLTATPATVPSPPVSVSATGAQNGSSLVSLVASATNGGSVVTSYTVTAIDLSTAANGGQNCVLTNPAGPGCTVGGLTNGDVYEFSAVANNSAGSSANTLSTPVVPSGAPSAPLGVSATGAQDSTTTVS